jgi:hypothetical protein
MDDLILPPPVKKRRMTDLIRAALASEFVGPMATTLVNAAGWLIVYFLVLSPQAEQNKSQSMLFNAQLRKLESVNEKLNDQIQLLRNRMQSATEVLAARQAVRPKLQFSDIDIAFPARDTISMVQRIKNVGLYPALIESPDIRLSPLAIADGSTANSDLLQGRDYEVVLQRPGMFLPGQEFPIALTVKIKLRRFFGIPIYFDVGWNSDSDPKAVDATREVLKDQITDDELEDLSHFHNDFFGSFMLQK